MVKYSNIHKYYVLKTVIYILFIIFIMISCQKTDINKKEIIVNLFTEPLTIDPSLNTDSWPASYMLHNFEGLVKKDENNNIIPGVAESWNISEDGLIYTIKLRTNAKWSDGKTVTSHDFVYTYQRIVNPKTAAKFSYFLDPIKNAKSIYEGKKNIDTLGVKALDDYTLEIYLETPTAYFLDLLAFPTYLPVRKDIIEKYGDKWTLNPESYIGNGPFKMIERKIDDKLVLERNTYYWDTNNIKLNKITFLLSDDYNLSLSGILNNKLNFSKYVSRKNLDFIKENNILTTKQMLATYCYRINNTNEVLNDIRVREALNLAIDRNYLVETITKLNEKPANAFVAYGINDYEGNFRENGKNYFDISKEGYSNNVIKAKKLLEEAGYSNKKFPPLSITIASEEKDIEIAEAIQNMLKENLNIDTIINKYDFGTYLSYMHSRNFELAMYSWYGDFNDPINFLLPFESTSFQNYGSFINEKYDNYIQIAITNHNNKYRMEVLHKAEDILIENYSIIPLYFINEAFLISTNIKNIEYDPMGMVRFIHSYIE
ncbi:peptide ABC transporter substrate-binding protein [Brachyspira suanatina]|uniref:Peptide ABC transporter substrate-binding protein n=1 Tax=Brachyspira suanatina TaxID=381802 RepID=A0A0G4KB61_9SPIR|nr:peptide ABC transporter substrate-binding protein [Brachyspira suanatina]CRF35686.1 peptide ABC transporter substrate-binding protein [Brachyspira suanatina]